MESKELRWSWPGERKQIRMFGLALFADDPLCSFRAHAHGDTIIPHDRAAKVTRPVHPQDFQPLCCIRLRERHPFPWLCLLPDLGTGSAECQMLGRFVAELYLK